MPEATEIDLRVKIPDRFREGLEHRFDPNRAKLTKDRHWWKIAEPCVLCAKFTPPRCEDCPFVSFKDEDEDTDGCMLWLKMVVLGAKKRFVCDPTELRWLNWRDADARRQLAEIRERAEELIEWVDDEPPDKESD